MMKVYFRSTPQPYDTAENTLTEPKDTLNQEGQSAVEKGKIQESPILVEELEELVEQVINTRVAVALNFAEDKSLPCQKVQPTVRFDDKFKTPIRRSEITGDLKKKCFLWATTLKTYDDTSTNEWDTIFIWNHEYPLKITRGHFASLKANTYVISAMCHVLNKKRIERFEEQIYYVPPDIVNLALGNHQDKFKQPKTNKPFDIQDYEDFIPYLDKKKFASHLFIFAPVCYAEHW
ncbi:hypothetical protein Ahy_B06g083644 isoform A [Arachis hypogaea]|uniref:Ubiquitin-like protease family profile domain-containing protein n=1 Tax=Arachis hypogaea TaxID=3818 RepID=A0A444YQA6_ARAHY|nr:hypothetical protein Ahy_B06g083644 isoform A [Arachis hypogaea]